MSSFDSVRSNNHENYPKRQKLANPRYEKGKFSSIIFTNLPNMHSDDIYEELYDAFIHIKFFNIQITTHHDQTVAYLNFEDYSRASRAYEEAVDSICIFDGQVLVAPVIRGQRTQPVKVRGKSEGRRQKRRVGEANEPCRVLFVGNLPSHITSEEVEKVFSELGLVDNVIIRSNDEGLYCFVSFGDIEMAMKAKERTKELRIGGQSCTIGYGKSIQSNCLYIGQVSLESRSRVLREFDKFGRIVSDFWPEGVDCCYIMFEDVSAAVEAYRRMKGFQFGSSPILVDYAKERHMTKEFADKCSKFRKGVEMVVIPSSPDYSLSSISDDLSRTLHQLRGDDPAWEGVFALKQSKIKVAMRFVRGKPDIVDYFMYNHAIKEPVVLSIVHRLKLEPDKLGEVRRRIESSNGGYSVLVAFPGKGESNLGILTNYLFEKKAAGVVQISISYYSGGEERQSSAILHAFPNCDFARELLSPTISAYDSFGDHFLTILIVTQSLPPLSIKHLRSLTWSHS